MQLLAEALGSCCPGCGATLTPVVEQSWHTAIAAASENWFEQSVDEHLDIIDQEYSRLRDLLREGQVYGALLQIKDVFEMLIKLPVLIAASAAYWEPNRSDGENQLLFLMLSKPLSLGDWRNIGQHASGGSVRLPAPAGVILKDAIRVFAKLDIPAWRNSTIGHGALGFDTDPTLRADIHEKLLAITEHFRRTRGAYSAIRLQPSTVAAGDDETLHGATQQLIAYIDGRELPLRPYAHVIDGHVYVFDAFYRKRGTISVLSYEVGRKETARLARLGLLYEHLVRSTQLRLLDQASSASPSRLEEDAVLAGWVDDDIVPPVYLVDRLKLWLSIEERGVFLLQMERGSGKSAFSRALDQTLGGRLAPAGVAVRTYKVDDWQAYRVGRFSWAVLDSLRKDDQGDLYFTSLAPELSREPDAGASLAAVLEFFQRRREQAFGDSKLVLVIDGVDEMPPGEGRRLFDLLPAPTLLGHGCYIILTARTGSEVDDDLQNRIGSIAFSDVAIFSREDARSAQLAYLERQGIPKPLWSTLIANAEGRFLHLRALVLAMPVLATTSISALPARAHLARFLIERLARLYGAHHFQEVSRMLCMLAHAHEGATIGELSACLNASRGALRVRAYIGDLRGFLRADRSPQGNRFHIAHPELAIALRDLLRAHHSAMLDVLEALATTVLSEPVLQDTTNERIHEGSWLVAELEDQSARWAPHRQASRATPARAENLARFARGLSGGSQLQARGQRILTAALGICSLLGDNALFLRLARGQLAAALSAAIEARIEDGDPLPVHVATTTTTPRAADLPTLRVLARVLYRTGRFEAAVALADATHRTSGSVRDLVGLVLTLKGVDSGLGEQYGMRRALALLGGGDLLRASHKLQLRQRMFLYYTAARVAGDTLEGLGMCRDWFERSVALAHRLEDEEGKLAAVNGLALHLFDLGLFAEALALLESIVGVGGTLLHTKDSHAREALAVNLHALSFLAGRQWFPPEPSKIRQLELRSYLLNNLAIEAIAAGDLPGASALGEWGLSVAKERGAVYARAALLNNLAFMNRRGAGLKEAYDLCVASGYSIGAAIVAKNLDLPTHHVGGVYSMGGHLLWPCLKNIDVFPPP